MWKSRLRSARAVAGAALIRAIKRALEKPWPGGYNPEGDDSRKIGVAYGASGESRQWYEGKSRPSVPPPLMSALS